MTNGQEQFTTFDEMVLTGDLREVQVGAEVRQLRMNLKALFAEGTEEIEEPEEE